MSLRVKKITLSIFSILLLLINSCASRQSVDNDFFKKETNLNKKSFIYLSYMRGSFGLMSKMFSPEISFTIKKAKGDGSTSFFGRELYFKSKLDLENKKGTILFNIEPGRYKITKIRVKNYSKSEDIIINAEKGKIVYLGYMTFKETGFGSFTSVKNEVINDYDKDIQIMKEKYPKLSDLEIINTRAL
jgi:hypothetical protein